MKRFDSCIIFSHERHLEVKKEFACLLFTESKLSKNLPKKSRIVAHHYIGCLVGNLIEAVLLQRNLALRISDGEPTPSVKNKILDGMVRLGLINDIRKGYSFSVSSSKIDKLPRSDLTKIEPNPSILGVFDPVTTKPSKTWSVVVRKEEGVEPVKVLAEEHALLYRCALKFQRQVNVPIRFFKRIFNEDLESGGRIYSNYQQMNRDLRSLITIRGGKTVELDYRYNQMRILFALFGIKDDGDPYLGFSEDRNIIKKAMNTLVNSANPKKVFCDMRWNAPFRWSSKKADEFIALSYARYPILEKMRGSGIGLKLQKIEGDIALAIMRQALYNNTVALPIHDAFIVREDEADIFRNVMEETWNEIVLRQKKNLL